MLSRWNHKAAKKGTGFQQPLKAHEHWHIDIAYVNICGTVYYLCSILDGFGRICAMTQVRTSPYYPQSNGKLERYHQTIKGTCIRVKTPLSLEDARAEVILAGREAKLAAAREARKAKRKAS